MPSGGDGADDGPPGGAGDFEPTERTVDPDLPSWEEEVDRITMSATIAATPPKSAMTGTVTFRRLVR